jgi:hypothetical protein
MTEIVNYTYRVLSVDLTSNTMKVEYTHSITGEVKIQDVRLPSVGEDLIDVVTPANPFLPHIINAAASNTLPTLPVVGQTGELRVANNIGNVVPTLPVITPMEPTGASSGEQIIPVTATLTP